MRPDSGVRPRLVIVLAIDTATSACSVAIRRDRQFLAHKSRDMARGHAEALLPMVAETLRTAQVAATAVELFAVTVGPGAFTGLRVGIAAARGLALAAGKPCVGVTTLEAVAHAVPDAERRGRILAVTIDTRRQDLFLQTFDAAADTTSEARVVAFEALAETLPPGPLLIAGDAAAAAARALQGRPEVDVASSRGTPDARVVAALAETRSLDGGADLRPPDPLYLRAPAATPAKPGRQLRR